MDEMTALQALEGVKKALADHLVRQLDNSNFTKEKALELLECDTELQVIAKALTPPTSEEVWEALSGYYHEDLNKHAFITYMLEDRTFTLFKQVAVDDCLEIDLVRIENGLIYMNKSYPPYLIKLIGSFYGGLK